MRRAKRKMDSQPSRSRLVGNYLSIIDQWPSRILHVVWYASIVALG
jgi:hypothetical protein